ncbi:hypothetical protein CYMTET_11957, partial [Cymbomonas tetramitiformis]
GEEIWRAALMANSSRKNTAQNSEAAEVEAVATERSRGAGASMDAKYRERAEPASADRTDKLAEDRLAWLCLSPKEARSSPASAMYHRASEIWKIALQYAPEPLSPRFSPRGLFSAVNPLPQLAEKCRDDPPQGRVPPAYLVLPVAKIAEDCGAGAGVIPRTAEPQESRIASASPQGSISCILRALLPSGLLDRSPSRERPGVVSPVAGHSPSQRRLPGAPAAKRRRNDSNHSNNGSFSHRSAGGQTHRSAGGQTHRSDVSSPREWLTPREVLDPPVSPSGSRGSLAGSSNSSGSVTASDDEDANLTLSEVSVAKHPRVVEPSPRPALTPVAEVQGAQPHQSPRLEWQQFQAGAASGHPRYDARAPAVTSGPSEGCQVTSGVADTSAVGTPWECAPHPMLSSTCDGREEGAPAAELLMAVCQSTVASEQKAAPHAGWIELDFPAGFPFTPTTAAPKPVSATATPEPVSVTATPEPVPTTAAPEPVSATAAPEPVPTTAAPSQCPPPLPPSLCPPPLPRAITPPSQKPALAAAAPRPSPLGSRRSPARTRVNAKLLEAELSLHDQRIVQLEREAEAAAMQALSPGRENTRYTWQQPDLAAAPEHTNEVAWSSHALSRGDSPLLGSPRRLSMEDSPLVGSPQPPDRHYDSFDGDDEMTYRLPQDRRVENSYQLPFEAAAVTADDLITPREELKVGGEEPDEQLQADQAHDWDSVQDTPPPVPADGAPRAAGVAGAARSGLNAPANTPLGSLGRPDGTKRRGSQWLRSAKKLYHRSKAALSPTPRQKSPSGGEVPEQTSPPPSFLDRVETLPEPLPTHRGPRPQILLDLEGLPVAPTPSSGEPTSSSRTGPGRAPTRGPTSESPRESPRSSLLQAILVRTWQRLSARAGLNPLLAPPISAPNTTGQDGNLWRIVPWPALQRRGVWLVGEGSKPRGVRRSREEMPVGKSRLSQQSWSPMRMLGQMEPCCKAEEKQVII